MFGEEKVSISTALWHKGAFVPAEEFSDAHPVPRTGPRGEKG